SALAGCSGRPDLAGARTPAGAWNCASCSTAACSSSIRVRCSPRSPRPRPPSRSRPGVIRTAIARGGPARRARRLDHSPRPPRPPRSPFPPPRPPRRPRPHPASVWLPRRRAIVPGGAMSVLPRMGPMRFLRRPRGPRPITPGAPPSRLANAASTRPSRGDIFTEQLAGHFHWTATQVVHRSAISGSAITRAIVPDSARHHGPLGGKGQPFEGNLDETSLTTKSRSGFEPVFFATAVVAPGESADYLSWRTGLLAPPGAHAVSKRLETQTSAVASTIQSGPPI